MKPDYTDALFEAGVLSYNDGDYRTAASALQSALKVDRSYVNAEYYLGLTFERVNDNANAITVFTDLASKYPQNTTVSAILTNLQQGKSIFNSPTPAESVEPNPVVAPVLTTKPAVKTQVKNKVEKSLKSASSSATTN